MEPAVSHNCSPTRSSPVQFPPKISCHAGPKLGSNTSPKSPTKHICEDTARPTKTRNSLQAANCQESFKVFSGREWPGVHFTSLFGTSTNTRWPSNSMAKAVTLICEIANSSASKYLIITYLRRSFTRRGSDFH